MNEEMKMVLFFNISNFSLLIFIYDWVQYLIKFKNFFKNIVYLMVIIYLIIIYNYFYI